MTAGSTAALLFTVMAASAVEAVEALTIVLASGITRGWRSTWEGVILALVALAAIVAILGTTIIQHVDINILRLVVGTLLLIFGLQWLTKAILRASGYKALHDESKIFAKEVAELSKTRGLLKGKRDSLAFVVSFKGVFLEGMEVVMIVVSFGLSSGNDFGQLKISAIGALIAIAIVAIAGVVVARPLSRVPENSLKLGVGILLVIFGTFWMGEGAGINWPLDDIFLAFLFLIIAGATFSMIFIFRRSRRLKEGGALN